MIISEGRARALEPEREELPSEFGVTVKDALHLLRKAKRCLVFYKVGPDPNNTALLQVSKRAMGAELKSYAGTGAIRPCELDPNMCFGPTLYFGGYEACRRAGQAHAEAARAAAERKQTMVLA